MANPVRNHLSGPGYNCKTGDRMDATSRHLCDEVKRLLVEYEHNDIEATSLIRELDNVCALVTLEGTTLPPHRLAWEVDYVDQWLPKNGS